MVVIAVCWLLEELECIGCGGAESFCRHPAFRKGRDERGQDMIVDEVTGMAAAGQLGAQPRGEVFLVAVALALSVDLPGAADQPVDRQAVAAREGRAVASAGQRFEQPFASGIETDDELEQEQHRQANHRRPPARHRCKQCRGDHHPKGW